MKRPGISAATRAVLLGWMVLALFVQGCGQSGGGSGKHLGAEHVSIFATGGAITAVTGETRLDTYRDSRTVGIDGSLIFFEVVSEQLIRISLGGAVEILATTQDLQLANGGGSSFEARLTSLKTMLGGTLDGHVIGRTRTGKLLRIDPSGQVVEHSPGLVILGPPIFYDEDQILVQDPTGAFLLVEADGTSAVLASAADVIAITGTKAVDLASSEIVVLPSSGAAFAVMGGGIVGTAAGNAGTADGLIGFLRVIRIDTDGSVTESFNFLDLIPLTGGEAFLPSNLTVDPASDTIYFLIGTGSALRRWVGKLLPNGTLELFTDLGAHAAAATAGIEYQFSGPGGVISERDIVFFALNFRLESFGFFDTGSGVVPFALEGFLQNIHLYDPSGVPRVHVGQPAIFDLVGSPIALSQKSLEPVDAGVLVTPGFGALKIPGAGVIVFDRNNDTFILIEL